MAKVGGCRRCGVGVPIEIAGDEDGSTFRCFNCKAQWTEPADKDAQAGEVLNVHPDISGGDLRALARAKGVDPDEYRTKDALIDATVQKAKPAKAASAGGGG